VDAAVTRTGYADFWELKARSVLPRETMNYVPIIIATTIIMKNARESGLEGIEVDPPLRYDTVMLDSATGLQLVADILDLPVAELREMNPPLLGNAAPAGYELRLPVGTGGDVKLWLARVPAEKRQLWRVHRMGPGETLEEVAKRNRTTAALTLAANPDLASASEILPGQTLVVPMAPEPPRPAYRYVWSRGRRVAVPVYPAGYRASTTAVKRAPSPVARPAMKAPVKTAAKAPAPKSTPAAKPAVKR
jgi:membrane-bound lytic murein transglycosylase D